MTDSPFEYDDTQGMERLPQGHPSRLLRALRDKIPENKELPKPQFVMDPRSISLANMIRGSLDTASNWLEGTKRPGAVKDEDMIGPLGGAGLAAAGMTKPIQGGLSAFIGPGQVERLGLTPGSRGSLGALEKAREIWAKGGTDPGALGETWAKHGWAPQEAFGGASPGSGQPFTWLEAPDLRLRDKAMDDIQAKLAKGDRVRYGGRMDSVLEPNSDMWRLFQAQPDLMKGDMTIAVGSKTPWQGYATTAGKFQGEAAGMERPMVGAQGRDPHKVESIAIGHELRGHAVPGLGGAQNMGYVSKSDPLYHTKANKILADDPRMREIAARNAAYFARGEERMARHAHVLDQIERQGGDPFRADRAPGVMSTYGDRAMIDRGIFNDMMGTERLHLRDLMPLPGKPKHIPLTADDLAPFLSMSD